MTSPLAPSADLRPPLLSAAFWVDFLQRAKGEKKYTIKAQTAYEIKILFAGTGKKDPLCGIKEKSGEDGILLKRKTYVSEDQR